MSPKKDLVEGWQIILWAILMLSVGSPGRNTITARVMGPGPEFPTFDAMNDDGQPLEIGMINICVRKHDRVIPEMAEPVGMPGHRGGPAF